jgi:hypothetical protein
MWLRHPPNPRWIPCARCDKVRKFLIVHFHPEARGIHIPGFQVQA